MGHRLTKIYTRTGDRGTTGLSDGSRVAKDHALIEAIGTVDELNSALGMVMAETLPQDVRVCLAQVQNDLFDLGGELSLPGHNAVSTAHVSGLEKRLDQFNATLPPLEEFILPGGNTAAAACHFARTVCRRAERRLVTLMHAAPLRAEPLAYLNRLSDLLFVIARVLSRQNGAPEVYWKPSKPAKDTQA